MPPNILCVIPARLRSTRLERKLLQSIEGKPLLYHTYRAALRSGVFFRTIIAVDDEELWNIAASFGAEVMMTSINHTCGTERVAEVARKIPSDLIVNLQADEPTISGEALRTLAREMSDTSGPFWTMACPVGVEEASRQSVVKVVVRHDGTALYFSRSLVPFPRTPVREFLKHLGVYGYTQEGLQKWVNLPPSPLEKAESLEQLRVLEAGYPIRVVTVTGEFVAVDTEADLWRARALLRLRKMGGSLGW
ncbi:MAG: 3-deoxy-manno-octulosonate cytidylyltransferase [bacterium JZ-2024 1]